MIHKILKAAASALKKGMGVPVIDVRDLDSTRHEYIISKAPVDEWLVMRKSGIAHKFYIMGGGYRYAACGFETHVDKLSTEGEVKKCPRCLKSKGW